MRNTIHSVASRFKKLIALAAAATIIAVPVTVSAFTGTYTGNGAPQFNIYQDVEGIGDERDFLRVGPTGVSATQYVNNFNTACDGKEVVVWAYVHNGAPDEFNGTDFDGTGVAKNTKLNIEIPVGTTNTMFNTKATISADNAASVSDTATIVCNDGQHTLSYVAGSAQIYNAAMGTVSLPDAVVNGGTKLGYEELNGMFPGCWQYVNYIKLTVKLNKTPTPPVTPPTTPPTTLPKTGAGEVIGLFAATSVAGGIAHNVVSRRRAAN